MALHALFDQTFGKVVTFGTASSAGSPLEPMIAQQWRESRRRLTHNPT